MQMINAAKALAEVDREDRRKDGYVTPTRSKRGSGRKQVEVSG